MISYSWPDGTLKWTGHSFAAEGALADSYHVAPGTPTEPKNKVNVTDSQSNVVVSTGYCFRRFNFNLKGFSNNLPICINAQTP